MKRNLQESSIFNRDFSIPLQRPDFGNPLRQDDDVEFLPGGVVRQSAKGRNGHTLWELVYQFDPDLGDWVVIVGLDDAGDQTYFYERYRP